MKYLTNIDLNKNQILNVVLQKLATAPSTPIEGQVYYNTTSHRAFKWNGSEWIGMDASEATMTGVDIVTAINGSVSLIDDDNLSVSANSAITNNHTHSNKTTLDNTTASFTTAQSNKLGYISVTESVNLDTMESDIETNNAKVTNATHTGEVTGSTDLTITNNIVTNAKLAQIATSTIKGRVSASTGNVEDLTATQVRTIINVADGANNYTHPTGDGNLHVPATLTTNNGKVLTAGSTVGSVTWNTPTVDWVNIDDKPSSTVSQIDSAVTNNHTHTNKATLDTYTQTEVNLSDAVGKKHSQNTDTGTSNSAFTIGISGVKVKNSSGTELQVRNNADSDYADLRVKNLYIEGSTTEIDSNTVNIGDSEIELNSNITTSSANSDGGITIKRLKADNVTRADAKITYNNSTNKWQTTQGSVAGTLITANITNKIVASIGDGSAKSYIITHNLNSQDLVVSIRETVSPFAMVMTDIEFTSVNTITVKFAVAPTSNQYTVTIIG